MKIRNGYLLRQVMDIHVVMGVGSAYSPNQIMSLNETGAYLWGFLENGAEKQDLIDKLISEYDVDLQTAENDVDAFLKQLSDKGILEE